MKTTYSKQTLNLIAITLLASISMGAITPTSDDFSSDTSGSWTDVGSIATVIVYDNNSASDWYDGDDATYIASYSEGMEITGDGVLNDGGLRLDTQNAIVGDEAMGLTIAGTMEAGEQITFTGNLYNDNTSYTDVNVQLWNLTDGTLLTESGAIRVKNYNNVSYTPVDFNLVYIAIESDAGDTLQIRFRDAGTATARDIFVDNYNLTSIPPAAGTFLAWDFNSDGDTGTVLTNNLAKYDYTSMQEYVGSNAVANTLAFHGRSTGTDYIIRDKGTGHEKSLYLKTIDTSGSDFGVYIQKMDFTLGGENATNNIRIDWSFDILGYDSNGNLNPSNWTVKVRTDNSSENLDLSDAWYSSAINAQTFNFVDDSTGETSTDGTWTTVTGSYEIVVGQDAGVNGGIQISTDNGGYTSAGGIFLDNIQISITPQEPDAVGIYDAWATGFGLSGPDALSSANPDGDLLNNLYEYGLGGNPTNPADTGYTVQSFTADEGGTNWLYVVHPEMNNALAGLTYSLQTDDDLVTAPSWSNATYEVLGTAIDGFGAGFNAVTNRISTDGKTQEFIKLLIEGTGF